MCALVDSNMTNICSLEPTVARHFSQMSTRGKFLVDYVWIGGSGDDLRSKTRVLDRKPQSVDELPIIKFDGNLTDQAYGGENCTVFGKPVSMAPDPFRGGDHLLVLCETFSPPEPEARTPDLRPHPTNNRAPCAAVMNQAAAHEPVFSIEQQYTLLDSTNSWPLGWPERASGGPTPSSYCSVGQGSNFGREFSETHFRSCLHAGIPISESMILTGYNSEEVRGQWSYKIGPSRGVDISDHLWLSRYILLRCSEQYNVKASFHAKPVPGDWNGNGAFVKFSTAQTRDGRNRYQAYLEIQRHIQMLEAHHLKHLMVYGSGNSMRMTGGMYPKLISPLAFNYAVGSVPASVRISDCMSHYEDRRPAANMDPYLVTMMLVCTTLGISFPNTCDHFLGQAESTYSKSSRGSSAILSELDRQDNVFAPETPPQGNLSLLDSECSSC